MRQVKRVETHSEGFQAVRKRAIECDCGGCCVYMDDYKCPRCGKVNDGEGVVSQDIKGEHRIQGESGK